MNTVKKIDAIDFIKALAITCVVAYHFITIYMLWMPETVRKLAYVLGTGCHAFLVVSGFGLFYSFKRRPLSAPRFWIKRLSKIYFPYIIVVYLSYRCGDIYLTSNVSRFSALMSHVFLYKMFFPQYEITFGGHFWFISTIIQFYFVFPLLVKLYNKLGTRRFLIGAFILNILWAVFTVLTGISEERVWNSFFMQFLFEFSLGMAAADHIDKVKDWYERSSVGKLLLIGAAGYAVLLITYFCGGVIGSFGDAPSAVGFVFCALALYKLGLKHFNSLMIRLSAVSYEWYLVHYLVLIVCYFRAWDYIDSFGKDLLFSTVIFFITLAAAIVFHYAWDGIVRACRMGRSFLARPQDS